MLTRSPRRTSAKPLWNPRATLRSRCWAKEDTEVRVIHTKGSSAGRDLGHLARVLSHILLLLTALLLHLEWCHPSAILSTRTIKAFVSGPAGKRSPTQTMYAAATQPPIETKNPRVNLLVTKWQHVWLLALDRRRKLNDALDRLEEVTTTTTQKRCSSVRVLRF